MRSIVEIEQEVRVAIEEGLEQWDNSELAEKYGESDERKQSVFTIFSAYEIKDKSYRSLIKDHVSYAPVNANESKNYKNRLCIYIESFSNEEVKIVIETVLSTTSGRVYGYPYTHATILAEIVDWCMRQKEWEPESVCCQAYDIKGLYGHRFVYNFKR